MLFEVRQSSISPQMPGNFFPMIFTLPETNSLHLPGTYPKRKLIFQPSFQGCKDISPPKRASFREPWVWVLTWWGCCSWGVGNGNKRVVMARSECLFSGGGDWDGTLPSHNPWFSGTWVWIFQYFFSFGDNGIHWTMIMGERVKVDMSSRQN